MSATRALGGRRWLEILGPGLGLVLVFGLFSLLAPEAFPTLNNLKTILTQTVIVGLGALGMTFVIASGGVDLSVGSLIALSSVTTAIALRQGAPGALAVAAGIAAGGACGLVSGLLVARAGIVPFIATLGMLGVARGFAKYLADEQKIDAPASWLTALMTKSPAQAWLLVAPGVWLLLFLALGMGLVLRRTVLGIHTIAIGSNEPAARLCGVPVERTKIVVYTLCGLCAGLAGVLQFARLTVGDPTTALGKELDVIAAVVIGGGSLAGGEGGIVGSLAGALFMAALANGCNLTDVPNYVQEIGIGAIIVAAVALDRWRRARG